jgi:hypothetical protein
MAQAYKGGQAVMSEQDLIRAAAKHKAEHDAKPIREGGIIPVHARLVEALESLRDRVDNFNQFPKLIKNENRVLEELKPDQFRWIDWEGYRFGYQMEILNVVGSDFMLRKVIVTVKGWRLDDLNDDDRQQLIGSISKVFFIPGGELPDIHSIDKSTMMFYQFIPIMFQYEKNPNIITPGAGYFKSLKKGDKE